MQESYKINGTLDGDYFTFHKNGLLWTHLKFSKKSIDTRLGATY